MIRAIPARILRQVLLVIVGAETGFAKETGELCCRWHPAGRLPVEAFVYAPVDLVVAQVASELVNRLLTDIITIP